MGSIRGKFGRFGLCCCVAALGVLAAACNEAGGGGLGRSCASQAECSGDTVCVNGACGRVECPQGGCPTGGYCSAGGLCVGRAVCQSAAECGDGKTCQFGSCVPAGGQCLVDTDCTGTNETCVNQNCVAASCEQLPCTGGKVCDPVTKRCGDCNTSDRQCATGYQCVGGKCEAEPPCDSQGRCAEAWQVCASGVCVGRDCAGDAGTCPNGAFCVGGRCSARLACTSDADCAAAPGTACDTTSGLCIQRGQGACAPCVVDAECNAVGGTANRCTPFTSGKFCTTDCSASTCGVGFSCFAATQQCLPLARSCTNNCALTPGSCTGGQVCLSAIGQCGSKLALCGTCGADGECSSGSCLRANAAGIDLALPYCGKACTGSGQGNCPAGFECKSGQCTTMGSTCAADQCSGVSCPQGKVCNPQNGQCVDCLNSQQCQVGATCNTTTHTCEVRQCTSDNDCNGLHCKTAATPKICVQCVVDGHCAGNGRLTKCLQATNECVEPNVCGGCPLGQVCDTNTLRCKPQGGVSADGGTSSGGTCSSPQDCLNTPPYLFCNPQTGRCEQNPGGTTLPGGCTTNADCNPGQTCTSLGGIFSVCSCDMLGCQMGNANDCCPNGGQCFLDYCLPM